MSRRAREVRVLAELNRIRTEDPRRYDEMMVLLAQLVSVARARKARAS
jgi:hypothetical protein